MRTKLMQLGTAAAFAALVAGPSLAQTGTSSTTPAPTSSSTGSMPSSSTTATTPGSMTTSSSTSMGANDAGKRDEVRVSKMVGSTVYNDQNQSIGTVDDILMTHDNKEPVRAVISVGGFLGIGSKLVEVPYDRLKLEANNKVVMPNASSDELKGMQSFSYNALDHSGTTNASGSSSGRPAGTATGAGMGTPSGVGSTSTTTTTHTTGTTTK